jgi:WD40 repeat protein/serine/threonine protein kinase
MTMSAPHSDREPVERLAEEFAERYRRGERPSLTEYVERYPDLGAEIRELFPALVLMEQFGSVAGPDGGPAAAEGRGPQQLGEYRILREVGRGGMGVVYEAVQESLGRHVALKVLPFHGLLGATHLERFRREARVAARLHHTNIVPVFGVGEHQGVHYYAMQFIHGQGLDAVLHELRQMRGPGSAKPGAAGDGGLSASIAEGLMTGCFRHGGPTAGAVPGSVTQPTGTAAGGPSSLACPSEAQFYRGVARVGVQVAEALAYAHQHGVLHRDVKPSNLLLDNRGTVWVTDFGLAKADGSDELTSPGDIVGTVRYMAPERFRGEADPRSDVYGLGTTLYELLTLSPAFDDTDRARLIGRVTHEDPPRPRQRDARIPRDLETIILKAMAREPADRYPGAEALAEDLRRFLADRPIQARRSSRPERAWRWCRRNPVVAGLTAAVACSLLLGTAVSILFAFDAREKLYHSLVGEARALRLLRESGYRPRVWERLQQARRLVTPGRDLDELRREAVACMGDFVGLEPKVWEVPGIGKAGGGQRLALHPDGSPLALGLDDGTVLVCDPATGGELDRLPAHRAGVSAVAFAPDGTHLVTGDRQGTVHVWERDAAGKWARTPRPLKVTLPLHPPLFGNDLAVAIRPSGRQVAVCPARGTATVWDLADGSLVAELQGPNGAGLSGPAWSPDGRLLAVGYFATGEEESGVLVWDVAENRRVEGPLNLGSVFTVAFSPDGRSLAAGCNEGFGVFDTSDPSHVRRQYRVPGDQARSLAFSPDGQRLFLASEVLGVVRILDLAADRPVAALQHPGGPFAVALSPDGNTLFALSRKSLRRWDLRAPAEKLVLSGHAGGVPGLAFSSDGRLLASAGKDETVKVWDPVTGEKVKDLPLRGKVQAVAFSPDSRTLATADWSGDLRLWDVPTWTAQTVPGHDLDKWIWTVAFSRDGTWFAAGGKDGLRVWRVPGRGEGAAPPGPPLQALPKVVDGEKITAVCFSPDSKRLAWVSRGADGDRCISLGDLPDLHARPLPARPANFVLPLAFSSDSRHLTFVGDKDVVEVWDVVSGRQVASYGSEDLLSGNGVIALSADGAWLASAGNRAVTVWDTESHKLLLALPEEGSTVWALAWSPDRELLAVSSSDGGPVIWNIHTIRAQLRTIDLDW